MNTLFRHCFISTFLGSTFSTLFFFVLFGLIWSYLVLFGRIWFYFVLFGFIWSYLVLFGLIWSYLVLSGVNLPYFALFCFICCLILFYFALFCLIVLSYAPSAAAVWQCDRVRAMCESNSVRHKSFFKALGLAPLGVLWQPHHNIIISECHNIIIA